MKKIIIGILILIMSLNILGCENKSGQDFNFDYTIKENYSEKITPKLSQAFLDFTKDTNDLYKTGFVDFKEYDPMKGITIGELEYYMYETLQDYNSINNWNVYEEEVLELMREQRLTVSDLALLKLTHTNCELDKQSEREPEFDEEYFDTEIEKLKIRMVEVLESTKEYIK